MSAQTPVDLFWKPSFNLFYDAYYQELASEAVLERWVLIDGVTSFLGASTATGSAVAGWALWKSDNGKLAWAILAAVASLASIIRTNFGVLGKIKEQEDLRRNFQGIRLAIDSFRTDLEIGLITVPDAQKRLKELHASYTEAMAGTKAGPAFTKALQESVEEKLRAIVKEKGYTS